MMDHAQKIVLMKDITKIQLPTLAINVLSGVFLVNLMTNALHVIPLSFLMILQKKHVIASKITNTMILLFKVVKTVANLTGSRVMEFVTSVITNVQNAALSQKYVYHASMPMPTILHSWNVIRRVQTRLMSIRTQ